MRSIVPSKTSQARRRAFYSRRDDMITEHTVETPVAKLTDIPDRGMSTVKVGNYQILLCRLESMVFAIRAHCSHQGAPLEQGHLEGAFLRCPRHGATFDVRTGSRVGRHLCEDLEVYPVVLKGEDIYVSLPAQTEQ